MLLWRWSEGDQVLVYLGYVDLADVDFAHVDLDVDKIKL